MTKSAWLALSLALTPLAQAQEPPSSHPGEFFEFLTDCLVAPERSVHNCAIEYVSILDSGSGQPVPRAVIKGKYNTCEVYPDTELKGDEKGYSCYNNISGGCVSGDCCGLFGGC
jgi:hypothetical protein